jgi:exodeoxyribonuclease VII large subunit
VFFELVEKGEADAVVGRLEAVLWRSDHLAVRRALAAAGQTLADGAQIRCWAQPDVYPPSGRLQLVVREVDPVFGLGRLAARRRETLAALAAAGLLDRNAALSLAAAPMAVALVTAVGSAAYHDFLSTLEESRWAFRVVAVDAAVQGTRAERSIASALAMAGALDVDVIALVRGGGAKSDLAAFDSRRVAEAVARSPRPVVTGLGHEIDETIADRVAHTAVKTPTRAAEFLVARVDQGAAELARLERELGRAAEARLAAARGGLAVVERSAARVWLQVARAASRAERLGTLLAREGRRVPRRRAQELRRLGSRLADAAPRTLQRRRPDPVRAASRLYRGAQARLRWAQSRLDACARLRVELGPERTLARGFSITRDSRGRLLRAARQVAVGDKITTELAGGRLASRVEEP